MTSSYGQVTFSTDSAVITMTPGTAKKCAILFTNSGSQDLQLSWKLIGTNVQDFGDPNGAWLIEWSDCFMAYTNGFSVLPTSGTCPSLLPPGIGFEWYIRIDPVNPVYFDSYWTVEIFNQTQNIKDTITYVFLGQPAPQSQIGFSSKTSSPQFISGRIQKSEIKFKNNWNHDVLLSWNVLSSTLLDYGTPGGAWNLSFSACSQVNDNSNGPLPSSDTCQSYLQSGDSSTWTLTVDPNLLPVGNEELVIEMFNHTDYSRDTLTFVLANSPVSVNEHVLEQSVSFYPNPANNQLIIESQLINSEAKKIAIYNVVGEEILSLTLEGHKDKIVINTQGLPNGMYFFSIHEINGNSTRSQKFLVQH